MKSTHNASTFKPYDPAETLGDTAPTAAKPPKKNKCGAFGQVLLVVIAAVVAFSTQQYLIGAEILKAGFAAGAVAGAAGSVASQAVGVATGIQEKFSWNSVALAAVSGGLSGGSADTWRQAAINGVRTNIATQGVGMALGLQKKFSWAGVAASGVSGAIGQQVGKGVEGKFGGGKIGAAATTATVATASSIANAATRSAIEGSNFGDNLRASIPDIIGQALASAITTKSLRRDPVEEQNARQANLVTAQVRSAGGGANASLGAGSTGLGPVGSVLAESLPEIGGMTVTEAQSARLEADSLFYTSNGLALSNGVVASASAMNDALNPLIPPTVTVTASRPGWSFRESGRVMIRAEETRQADASRRAAYDQRFYVETGQWRSNLATVQSQMAVARELDGYLYDAALIAVATPLVMAGGVAGMAGAWAMTVAGAGFSLGALTLGGVGGGIAFAAPASAYSQFSAGGASLGRFGGDVLMGGINGGVSGVALGKLMQGAWAVGQVTGFNAAAAAMSVSALRAIGNSAAVAASNLKGLFVAYADDVSGSVPLSLGKKRIGPQTSELPSGSFSIWDWSGYPTGVPRPQGPFRILEGSEYDAARTAANRANAALRRDQGLVGQAVDVHEIHPVKFGGSPTDPANKIVLPRDVHRQQVTPWWNQLQSDLGY